MDNITKSHLDNFINKLGKILITQAINGNILKSDLEAVSTGQSKGVIQLHFV